jgi:hypothetical protein
MPNQWVEHVRKYAKDNNISYMCAITEAKGSYVKKSATKAQTAKPEAKKDNTGDEIKKLEGDLASIEKEYYNEITASLIAEAVGGRRMPPARTKYFNSLNAQYNGIVNKLSKLTKKSYTPLDNISQIRKDTRKEYKKYDKSERERERLVKLQPVIPDDPNAFKLGMGRKKSKGIS